MLNPRLLMAGAFALATAACTDQQGSALSPADRVCFVNATAVTNARTPATPVLVRMSQAGVVLNPEALPRGASVRYSSVTLDRNWQQANYEVGIVDGVGATVCEKVRTGMPIDQRTLNLGTQFLRRLN